MSAPRAWKDGGDVEASEARAAALVREEASASGRPVEVHAGWDAVVERVAARPSELSQVALFFGAMAVGVALTLVVTRLLPGAVHAPPEAPLARAVVTPTPPAPLTQPRPTPLAPPEVVRSAPTAPPPTAAREEAAAVGWVASPGARWARLQRDGARLSSGRLERAASGTQVRLESQAATVVSAGRFAAEVTAAGTEVTVIEGNAEVWSRALRVTLSEGQQRRFALATFALDPLLSEQGNPACSREAFDDRLTCLSDQARGDGLKAQAALYERGWLLANAGRTEAAAGTLRESLQRFPEGVLHPEVRLALMRVLMADEAVDPALEVARRFLVVCPEDPRREDVASWVGTLEWLRGR